ncbi:MAG: hypothetical protein IPH03_02265 [Tetrasphaera sp.]|jgi:hypothetical protein|nr:hypothetical protein [Tetrasphaera sp.]
MAAWRRRLVIVAVATVMSAASCSGARDASAALVGYRLGATDRELVLVVETGPEDEIDKAVILTEDSSRVKVDVKMKQAQGLQPAQAIRHEVSVVLTAPLGQREVQASTGRALDKVAQLDAEPK